MLASSRFISRRGLSSSKDLSTTSVFFYKGFSLSSFGPAKLFIMSEPSLLPDEFTSGSCLSVVAAQRQKPGRMDEESLRVRQRGF